MKRGVYYGGEKPEGSARPPIPALWAEPDSEDITRVVVVNYRQDNAEYARQLDIGDSEAHLALQDGGRTLKVFIYDREEA